MAEAPAPAAAPAAPAPNAAPAPSSSPSPAPAPAAPTAPAAAPAAAPDRTSLVSAAKPEAAAPAADPAKPVEGEPIKYDFKLPEGLTLDEKQTQEIQAAAQEVFKDTKITPEQAQTLFERHVTEINKAIQTQHQQWFAMQETWKAEIRADAEVGGQNLDRNLGAISKLITEFGGKEADAIKQALDFTGAGNNPAVIRLFHRLAQAATESGEHVGGDPAGQTGLGTQRTLAALYPSSANAQQP